jgi:Na+/melibiose symporter-like transporter
MKGHSFLTRLAYASGTVSFAVKDVAFGSFVLFYYVSVVGLQGKLAGTVLLIAMVWDAITDPLVGSISDNFRSRWGRRHPFMAISGIPLALCLFALFNVPDGLGQTEIFLWMLIVCLLLRTFLTLFTVPYLALGAELSEDYHERSAIAGTRTLFGWITAIGLAALAWGAIFKGDGITDGRLISENYYHYGLISMAIVAIFTTISLVTTARHIPDLPSGSDIPVRFSFTKLFLDIGHALRNRNFRNLFWVMLTLGAGVGIGAALGTHMATYFWELTTQQLFYQTLFTFVPIAFMLGVMDWLSKRIEKHIILQICTFVFAANTIWLVSLRLLGILPDNGHPLIFALILVTVFIGSATTIWFQTITSSVIADIGDEQELLTHERQEGMFFAAQGFSIKFVTGIGSFVGGFVLDIIQMPAYAAPGSIPSEVVFKLGIVMGPILTVCMIVPYFFARKITLTRERHDEIRLALEERHAQDAPATG